MRHIPDIMCDQCHQRVERVHWTPEVDGGFRLKVECHGDNDEMLITPEMLHSWPDMLVTEVTAFRTKRIAP